MSQGCGSTSASPCLAAARLGPVMDRNPQGQQMADESMVRNLAAQAEAIWPQEKPLFERYAPRAILDIGCGTGEITSRLAALFPQATAIGIDVIDAHLALARDRYASLGDRVQFTHGDAFELAYPVASFDLTVCRHVLQAVPEPERVVAEMVRVTRPGGYVHILAEDYGTIAQSFTAWRDGYVPVIVETTGMAETKVREMFDATIEAARTGYLVWTIPIASARVRG